MKILFVAMSESIHSTRWISQIAGQGWDVYLFPTYHAVPHPGLRNLTLFGCDPLRPAALDGSVHHEGWTSYYFYRDTIERRLKHHPTLLKEAALARVIRSVKPDLIHSLEIQHAGYLTMGAKKILQTPFPKWIVTNWGSDIYLFGRLAAHRERIREILENCDLYSCECERDMLLARDLGLRGQPLPIFPNSGGFDLAYCQSLRQPGPISQRKNIMLKGYQGWAGRALSALRALEMCADLLRAGNYQLTIYSANNPEVPIAAELFSQNTGIKVNILPQTTHEELLRYYGSARLYIGSSISDAISTSLLEAMVMGAFPIQSRTACADEWIVDGQSGFIIPPEDPEIIANAIRRALSDDALVDRAAEINAKTARERLDYSIIQPQVIKMYQDILAESR